MPARITYGELLALLRRAAATIEAPPKILQKANVIRELRETADLIQREIEESRLGCGADVAVIDQSPMTDGDIAAANQLLGAVLEGPHGPLVDDAPNADLAGSPSIPIAGPTKVPRGRLRTKPAEGTR